MQITEKGDFVLQTCTIVIGKIPSNYQKHGTLIAIVSKELVTSEVIDQCDELYVLNRKRWVVDLLAELRKYYRISELIVNDEEDEGRIRDWQTIARIDR